MKTKILILFLTYSLAGCDGFLEEQSQTEIRPSTVLDMEKLLEGEAYCTEKDAVFSDATDIFTDDNMCNVVSKKNKQQLNLKEHDKYKFIWSNTMFNDNGDGSSDIDLWQTPYKYIKGSNVILDYIDDMIADGKEGEIRREHLKGEALVLRGLYHFYLLNFFGLPYNHGDPAQNLGVPLKLISGVTTDEYPKREMVAECYKQIEQDLLEGTQLMSENREEASEKIKRIDYLLGYTLLSRMHLYMENWDKAREYADSVLMVQPDLLMFSENPGQFIYTQYGNCEILWAMPCFYKDNQTGIRYPYTASNDLMSIFSEDLAEGEVDLRIMSLDEYDPYSSTNRQIPYLQVAREYLYDDNNNYIGIQKYYILNKGYKWTGMRTAELYLNRAEAYIQKYIQDGNISYAQAALDDLNNLRRHRMDPNGFTEKVLSDYTDGQALLEFCWRERRRELCGEGNHRWLDLRRQGMPQITHIYLDNDTGFKSEYVLQKEDSRYTLPIPQNVLDRNPDLEQNK